MIIRVGQRFRATDDMVEITINHITDDKFVFYTVTASDNYVADEINTVDEIEEELADGWEELV